MTQVTMTSPQGVTLDTAGKYCPQQVRVVPNLQALSLTPSSQAQSAVPDENMAGFSAVHLAAMPYESQEMTFASGTETVVVPIDPDVNAVFIYLENTDITAFNSNVLMGLSWFRGTTTYSLMSWFPSRGDFMAGGSGVTVTDSTLSFKAISGVLLTTDRPYRVIKVRGVLQ